MITEKKLREPYKSAFREEENIKSAIGAGWIDILRDSYTDPLSVFKKEKKVLVAKDLQSAIDLSLEGKPVVLVVKGPMDILWAKPVVDGKLVNGMFSGAWVYTSNGVVMEKYSHPIRLMDRVER